tara:strand:+ start:896 stop:1228 length:333 start_codon:yes stop_codon:yes gene_type:complete
MNFYMWRQNNTGGSFITDGDLSRFVVIEAESYEKAEEKALNLGVYYNGVDSERDCSCCGDRWYEGDMVIPFADKNIEDYLQREEDEYPCRDTMTILHLADGSKKTFKGRT